MDNHQKITRFKFFGFQLFEKIETYLNYEQINVSYKVNVSKDYYNAEFKDKDA